MGEVNNSADYQRAGGNIILIINANQMIVAWLTKHISTMDKKIGTYAKTCKKLNRSLR